MSRRTASAVAVVAVTTALLGAGVFRAWADSGPVSLSDASTDAGAVGALDWQPCADATTFDCANLPVPIDWHHPHGASVDLAVVRHKASDPTRRIGTLVLNPSGPGGSGWTTSSRVPARSPRTCWRASTWSVGIRVVSAVVIRSSATRTC